MIASASMENLRRALGQNTLVRIIEQFEREHPDSHLKDLVIDEAGPGRRIVVEGHPLVNFGSDSFLGLDQDPRVQDAVRRGIDRWGTHNGASRAFASVRANIEAEEKLADWLGVESVLILPSVMLANFGALPGLAGRQDAIAMDEQAHSSMQENYEVILHSELLSHLVARPSRTATPRPWSGPCTRSAPIDRRWSASTGSTA